MLGRRGCVFWSDAPATTMVAGAHEAGCHGRALVAIGFFLLLRWLWCRAGAVVRLPCGPGGRPPHDE